MPPIQIGTVRIVPEPANPCRGAFNVTTGGTDGCSEEEQHGARTKQDRPRVAGGQGYEVQYEAKKTGKSAPAVKKAVKKVGDARKRMEKQ
ncbi:hypothetical protein ACVMB0_000378 [Bradyrhizobium sp. USDA 4451]